VKNHELLTGKGGEGFGGKRKKIRGASLPGSHPPLGEGGGTINPEGGRGKRPPEHKTKVMNRTMEGRPSLAGEKDDYRSRTRKGETNAGGGADLDIWKIRKKVPI